MEPFQSHSLRNLKTTSWDESSTVARNGDRGRDRADKAAAEERQSSWQFFLYQAEDAARASVAGEH